MYRYFLFIFLCHNQIYTFSKLLGLQNLKDLISLFATLSSMTINHHVRWSFLKWRLYSLRVFKMHFPVATGSCWFSFSSGRIAMCRNLFRVVWYVTENTTLHTTVNPKCVTAVFVFSRTDLLLRKTPCDHRCSSVCSQYEFQDTAPESVPFYGPSSFESML